MKVQGAEEITEKARWMIVVSMEVTIDTGWNDGGAKQRITEVHTFETQAERDKQLLQLLGERATFRLFEITPLSVQTTMTVNRPEAKR